MGELNDEKDYSYINFKGFASFLDIECNPLSG